MTFFSFPDTLYYLREGWGDATVNKTAPGRRGLAHAADNRERRLCAGRPTYNSTDSHGGSGASGDTDALCDSDARASHSYAATHGDADP